MAEDQTWTRTIGPINKSVIGDGPRYGLTRMDSIDSAKAGKMANLLLFPPPLLLILLSPPRLDHPDFERTSFALVRRRTFLFFFFFIGRTTRYPCPSTVYTDTRESGSE